MKRILIVIAILGICVIYRVIFLPYELSGGDYIGLTESTIQYYRMYPFQAWDTHSSLGANNIAFINTNPYAYIVGIAGIFLSESGVVLERIFYWFAFLIISSFAIVRLAKYIFPQMKTWFFAMFIFTCNTYILMIISGGQISGIGLAYAVSPLVLYRFLVAWHNAGLSWGKDLYLAAFCGILISVQFMFDLRIAYVTLSMVVLYIVVFLLSNIIEGKFLKEAGNYGRKVTFSLLLPLMLVGVINLYWILPLTTYRVQPFETLGQNYNSIDAVNFFSFAKMENTISLLHPNWPENIFGKTYFMRSEFLLLPLIAYSILLFLSRKKNMQYSDRNVYFIILLGLIGAFLAKGAQEPFGEVYLFFFDYVPGFVMFRDPTKWYLMVAVSYSIIIPVSIEYILHWINNRIPLKTAK